MKGETTTRDISQDHNEIDQEGSVEGVGAGDGSEFEGDTWERIYLGAIWNLDQEEILKVT